MSGRESEPAGSVVQTLAAAGIEETVEDPLIAENEDCIENLAAMPLTAFGKVRKDSGQAWSRILVPGQSQPFL